MVFRAVASGQCGLSFKHGVDVRRPAGPGKALEDSLAGLLDRHEALRTTFSAVDGVPVQLIAPSLHIDLPLVDVSQPVSQLLTQPRLTAWRVPAPIMLRSRPPPSILFMARCCAPAWCASRVTITGWCWCCIISSPMAGRWRSCTAIFAPSIQAE